MTFQEFLDKQARHQPHGSWRERREEWIAAVTGLTEAYKSFDPDLIEQVNQVRRYRNWVARGRRGKPENAVDPNAAYARLQRFLDRLTDTPA